ncbi:hypothetical protein HaLaN_28380, partial [Haematococcus lacustris]
MRSTMHPVNHEHEPKAHVHQPSHGEQKSWGTGMPWQHTKPTMPRMSHGWPADTLLVCGLAHESEVQQSAAWLLTTAVASLAPAGSASQFYLKPANSDHTQWACTPGREAQRGQSATAPVGNMSA